jgi:hypothetical protein
MNRSSKVLVLMSLFLTSCASMVGAPTPRATEPYDPDPVLAASMEFTAESKPYKGVAVLPRRTSTKFKFTLPKDTHLFLIDTCRRERFELSPALKEYEYIYIPAMWKENTGVCPLVATAITKSGETHLAVSDFDNLTGRDIAASVMCNGEWVHNVVGSYLCQVRAGLPVSIQFKEETVSASQPPCTPEKDLGRGKEYDIDATKGFCSYGFMNQKKETFRLLIRGYTSILNVYPPRK